MVSESTYREMAIRFLRGSVDGGAKSGDMLGPHLFKGPIPMPGVLADFPPAMDFAALQGWVEKLGPDQYRLTDAGFAATQSAN
jgi:hypothetical protein